MDNNYFIPFFNPLYNSVTNYWKNKEKKILDSKSQPHIFNNSSYQNNYKENKINNNDKNDDDIYCNENEKVETPRTQNLKLHQEMFNFDFNNRNNNYWEKNNIFYNNKQNNFIKNLTKDFANILNLQNKKAMNDLNKIKKECDEMKNDLENRFEEYEKKQNNLYKILKRHVEEKLKKNQEYELNYKIRKLNNKQKLENIVDKYLENFENKNKINKIIELKQKYLSQQPTLFQNSTERIYPIRNYNSNLYNQFSFNQNLSNLPNINRHNSFHMNLNKKNRTDSINTERLNNLILQKIDMNQKRIKDIYKQNYLFQNYFNNILQKVNIPQLKYNKNINSMPDLNNINSKFDEEPNMKTKLKKYKSALNLKKINLNKNNYSNKKSKSKNKNNKKKKK